MLACFTSCPSTKGLIKDITDHIKDMSLVKAVRVRRRRKMQRAEEAEPASEACQGRVEEEEEEEEWVAEPETGVLITLLALPNGRNHVRKIRFSKEAFDDWGAQKWWSENYDKIMELYNIDSSTHSSPRPSSTDDDCRLAESLQVEDEEETGYNDALGSDGGSGASSSKLAQETKPQTPGLSGDAAIVGELAAAVTTGDVEVQGKVLEWVAEDEAGVFVTVRSMPDGSREILRVELSRERFGETKARAWWEENEARLHNQYANMQ